jgi:hypothetical protein
MFLCLITHLAINTWGSRGKMTHVSCELYALADLLSAINSQVPIEQEAALALNLTGCCAEQKNLARK